MKRPRVVPRLVKTIVHPGWMLRWYERLVAEDEKLALEAQFGKTGTHEPVSMKQPSSTVSGERSRVEGDRHG